MLNGESSSPSSRVLKVKEEGRKGGMEKYKVPGLNDFPGYLRAADS
jgi:hypothetical protein